MRAAILSRRCCGDARVCALLRKLCEQGHPIGHTVVRHSRGLGIARSRRRWELSCPMRKFVRIALILCLSVTAVPAVLFGSLQRAGFGTRLLKSRVSIKNIACCAKCAPSKPIAPTIPDRHAKCYCRYCRWERIERRLTLCSAEKDWAVRLSPNQLATPLAAKRTSRMIIEPKWIWLIVKRRPQTSLGTSTGS